MEDWTPLPTIVLWVFFVLFLGKRDKTKPEILNFTPILHLLNFTFTEKKVILLFQFVMDKFLKHETQKPIDNQILESDEEAGYVLYSLKNSIKNPDPYLKKEVSRIIGSWGGKKDMGCSSNITFLEYTRYWAEKVNRGGLIYVTDDFYKFIRKIEYTDHTGIPGPWTQVLETGLWTLDSGRWFRFELKRNTIRILC